MKEKFIYNDLVTFHKIVHNLIPISLPSTIVIGHSRTRSGTRNSDHLTYTVDGGTLINKQVLSHDFFIRCINTWNSLPLNLRENVSVIKFSSAVKSWSWNELSQSAGLRRAEHELTVEPD